MHFAPPFLLIFCRGLDLSCPWLFRIDLHATCVAPDDNENQRFDMPWQVATYNEDWTQHKSSSWFFKLKPHATSCPCPTSI